MPVWACVYDKFNRVISYFASYITTFPMRNLIEFLTKYNHWFVFAILEVVVYRYCSNTIAIKAAYSFLQPTLCVGKYTNWTLL